MAFILFTKVKKKKKRKLHLSCNKSLVSHCLSAFLYRRKHFRPYVEEAVRTSWFPSVPEHSQLQRTGAQTSLCSHGPGLASFGAQGSVQTTAMWYGNSRREGRMSPAPYVEPWRSRGDAEGPVPAGQLGDPHTAGDQGARGRSSHGPQRPQPCCCAPSLGSQLQIVPVPARSRHKPICSWIQTAIERTWEKPQVQSPDTMGRRPGEALSAAGVHKWGCGTTLCNEFCWPLAIKSACLWMKFLNLEMVQTTDDLKFPLHRHFQPF